MAFDTRQEAYDTWVPDDSFVVYDYESTVVYVHKGRLVVLRIFSVSTVHLSVWHVSIDVDRSLDDLKEYMK